MQLYIYNGQVTSYYITTTGELFNSKTGNWLKGQYNKKNGYKSYNISIDGEHHRLYAHRMVAETYLPRIEGKTEVNHIDGNKKNNNLENLEWVNSKENKIHAKKIGLYDNNLCKVYCFDENKKLVCVYESIRDACAINHFNESWMVEQLNRKIKTLSHGYYWSRTSNNDFEIQLHNNSGRAVAVGQYTIDGVLVEKFKSYSEVERKTGYRAERISDCCNGRIKTYRGYIWKKL